MADTAKQAQAPHRPLGPLAPKRAPWFTPARFGRPPRLGFNPPLAHWSSKTVRLATAINHSDCATPLPALPIPRGRHSTHPLIAGGKIEAPLRILLHAGDEIMPPLATSPSHLSLLAIIRFVIAIGIMQPRDLIPPRHQNLIIHHLHPNRLMQSRRKAFPGHRLQFRIQTVHQPHLSS